MLNFRQITIRNLQRKLNVLLKSANIYIFYLCKPTSGPKMQIGCILEKLVYIIQIFLRNPPQNSSIENSVLVCIIYKQNFMFLKRPYREAFLKEKIQTNKNRTFYAQFILCIICTISTELLLQNKKQRSIRRCRKRF